MKSIAIVQEKRLPFLYIFAIIDTLWFTKWDRITIEHERKWGLWGYFKVIQHDHFSSTWPVVLNFVLAKYFWRASWTSAQYKTRHSTENTVQGQPESSTWPYGSTWPYQILESWKRVQHDHWIQHSQYSTQPTRKFNMTKGFNMTKPDFRILKKS